MMLHALVVMTTLFLAGADQTLDELRPDVRAGLQKAEGMLADFEEARALAELDTLAARTDLTASEVAHIQMWRGTALMALLKTSEASAAFALSRGCNPLVEPPRGMSPKVRKAFTSTAPADCPVGAPRGDPTEGLEQKPTATAEPVKPVLPAPAEVQPEPAPAPSTPSRGPRMAGVGLAVVGAPLILASVAAVAVAAILVAASFPVVANAQSRERAVDVLQMARVALGMRIAGGVLVVGALVLGLAGLAVAAGGVAFAASGTRAE